MALSSGFSTTLSNPIGIRLVLLALVVMPATELVLPLDVDGHWIRQWLVISLNLDLIVVINIGGVVFDPLAFCIFIIRQVENVKVVALWKDYVHT